MFWFKSKQTSIKKFGISPPVADAGRTGLAIAVCVKDEGSYISEWARYHHGIGVRHFHVYDNGSADDTCAVLKTALPPEALTIIPWAGRMFDGSTSRLIDLQALAFAHAIINFGGAFRRMAFIDVDEFLLPKVGNTLDEALAATQGFPNVSLPWHMFGTGGHDTRPPGPVLLNYTARSADPLSRMEHSTNFKCIVDPCEVVEVSVHQFRTREFGDLTVNDAGRRFSRRDRKSQAFYSNGFLQLNHYYSKSRQEMRAKFQRGSNYAVSTRKLEEKMNSTLKNIEHTTVEDRSMIEFLDRVRIDLR
jgi:hypothetical protein